MGLGCCLLQLVHSISVAVLTVISPDTPLLLFKHVSPPFSCSQVNQPLAAQVEVNDYCHAHGKQFISTEAAGVFGYTFCDFGDAFVVTDTNGEPASSCVVASITQANPALVTVLDGDRHNLESGDTVSFDSLDGMEELLGREFVVTVKDGYSFEIDVDTTGFSPYRTGGYVNQVKKPVALAFKPLRQALVEPGDFLLSDFAKFEQPGVLHQAFRALHEWRAGHGGGDPVPGEDAPAAEVAALARALNSRAAEGEFRIEDEALDRHAKVFEALAKTAAGVISPMCAFLGGVAGQEVLKACSGEPDPPPSVPQAALAPNPFVFLVSAGSAARG